MNRQEILKECTEIPLLAIASHVRNDIGNALEKIPEHMLAGLARYLVLGIRPGRFLCAILSHEEELATRAADKDNRSALHHYANLLLSLPVEAHGSAEKVRAWCEAGGQLGRKAQNAA